MMDAKEKRLQQLVAKVQKNQKAFLEIAKAIYEIARDELHGSTSLAKFCANEFDFSMNDTARYKDAGCVLERLNDFKILPTNEAQCRELAKLDSVDLVETWQRVIDSSEKITAALIAGFSPQDEKPQASTSKSMSEWLNDRTPVVVGDFDNVEEDVYEDAVGEVPESPENFAEFSIAAIENLEDLAGKDLNLCHEDQLQCLFDDLKKVRFIADELMDRVERLQHGRAVTLTLPLGHIASEVPV